MNMNIGDRIADQIRKRIKMMAVDEEGAIVALFLFTGPLITANLVGFTIAEAEGFGEKVRNQVAGAFLLLTFKVGEKTTTFLERCFPVIFLEDV